LIRLALALAGALALPLPASAAVDIVEVSSPGGVTAWLVQEPSIPFAALELRFRGGASLDDPARRGAINLMVALLEEGAGDLDAQGFAVAAEALAADFDFDVSADSVQISARFLTENRDEVLALLRSALVEPRFDAEALERVRGQVLSGIASDAQDPEDIASVTFNRLAWGEHPYGAAQEGTAESVAALTRDDILAAHARVFARDRVYAAAVGDIDAATLGAALDSLLSALPAEGAALPPRAAWSAPGGLTVVDFDTPQSVVMFGHDGIDRDDPDFFPAFVMMQVLGGSGFSSRLMTEVREKRGLTYGIGAYLADRDLSHAIMGSVSTVNGRVAETIEVIRAEWTRMAEGGLTAEELERAQTYLTGAYPLRFDGNGRIANILVGMQLDGLGIDYIATRNDKVRAVTLEDVQRVAARLIRTEALHFVVVGRPEGLATGN
jgi:zinc protease